MKQNEEIKNEEIEKSATFKFYLKKGISEEKALKMIKEVEEDFKKNNYIILA